MGDKFIFGCPSPPPLSNTKLIVVRGGAVNGYGGWGRGRGRSYNTSPYYLPHPSQIIYKF